MGNCSNCHHQSVLQLLICLFQRIKSMMERARYEQQRREEVVFAEEVDFSQCHVDPSPFQLVERTSLLKVIWGLTRFLWGSGVLNLWLQLKLTSQLRTYSHIADYKFVGVAFLKIYILSVKVSFN